MGKNKAGNIYGRIKKIVRSKIFLGAICFLIGIGTGERTFSGSEEISKLKTESLRLKEASELTKRQEEEKRAMDIKIEEEKTREEHIIAREKAEKKAEAKKYYTGITYENLTRNPKDHKSDFVRFKGRVVEVMKGEDEIQCSMAIDSNYYQVVLLVLHKSRLLDEDILEGDIITIEGKFLMEMEYTTLMRESKDIPAISVDNIYG